MTLGLVYGIISTQIMKGGFDMVIARENKEQKQVNIYFITDDMDTVCQSELYEKEVKRFSESGYTINSFIFPDYNELPANVQELYNDAYFNKSILDSFVCNGADVTLWDSICQVVKQRIEGFDKEDWQAIIHEAVFSLMGSAEELKIRLNELNRK